MVKIEKRLNVRQQCFCPEKVGFDLISLKQCANYLSLFGFPAKVLRNWIIRAFRRKVLVTKARSIWLNGLWAHILKRIVVLG